MAGTEEAGMSFAERMMKNMGWSQGKGLGREEAGMKDFIKPKMKFNTKGIGFMGVDNKWIAHQEHFDDLLTSLNKGEKPAEKKDIACLTSTSKLRGRTKFYAKMMRGKDLSNRSSQDLSAIIVPLSKKDETEKAATTPLPSELDGTLKSSQVSMDDYFAKMMARRKSKLNDNKTVDSDAEQATSSVSGDRDEDSSRDAEKETKQKRKKNKHDHVDDESSLTCDQAVIVDEPSENTKKKRKRKNGKVDSTESSDLSDQAQIPAEVIEIDRDPESEDFSKRKSKKMKSIAIVEVDIQDGEKEEPKSRKSRKRDNPEAPVEELAHETHNDGTGIKKKKKRSKGAECQDGPGTNENQEGSKKSKRSKRKGADGELEISENGKRLNIDVNLLKKIRGSKLAKSKAAPVRELTDVQIQEIHRMWTSGEYAEFMSKVHSGELPRWVAVEKPLVERMIMGRTKLLDLADVRDLVRKKWKNANIEEIWGYTNVAYLTV